MCVYFVVSDVLCIHICIYKLIFWDLNINDLAQTTMTIFDKDSQQLRKWCNASRGGGMLCFIRLASTALDHPNTRLIGRDRASKCLSFEEQKNAAFSPFVQNRRHMMLRQKRKFYQTKKCKRCARIGNIKKHAAAWLVISAFIGLQRQQSTYWPNFCCRYIFVL